MTEQNRQAIRHRRLAAELRRLRERAGLTGDQVASRLGWSNSKISRIETHRTGVKPADLRKLLDLYNVDGAYRTELQALAHESIWERRLESVVAGLPADYAEYVSAEDEARSIWSWDPLLVPGLLQTEAYTRALFVGYQSMFRLPPADAERRIELRQIRQQLLIREPLLQLSVVIDESVLLRRFGDRTVMHQQLTRLIHLTGLPNVEVRVLRLDGQHPIGTGSFSYLQFGQVHDVPLNDIVTLEHLTGTHYLEDPEHTFRYRVTFESLVEKSLSPDRSRDLIRDAGRDS